MSTEKSTLSCQRCGAELHPGRGDFYLVSIVAVADPTPPVIAAEDLDKDVGREIHRLVKHLEGVEEQEALDQVYRRVVLNLCVKCYQHWIEDPIHP